MGKAKPAAACGLALCLLVAASATVRFPDASASAAATAAPAAASPAPAPATSPSPSPSPRSRCAAGQLALPGGRFRSQRAAPDEAPREVASFCLDLTEVTVAAYRACVAAGACSEPDLEAGEACNGGEASGRGAHPINCVAQAQASAFCAWRGQRLPTAAELEWAQRGGPAATRYPWGDDDSPRRLCPAAAPRPVEPGAPVSCPVAACPLSDSPSGLHDLAGNVAEWTASVASREDERLVCGGQTVCGAQPASTARRPPPRRGKGRVRLPASLAAGACLAVPASAAREGVGFRCAGAPR